MAVEIGDGAALSGHLLPSSYVDVIWTTETNDQVETHTVVPLQALFVLAVNEASLGSRSRTERGSNRSTVTLLVTPVQAEALALAEAGGAIHLSLRPDMGDLDYVATTGVDRNAFFDFRENLASSRAQRRKPVTQRVEIKAAEEANPSTIVTIIEGGGSRTLTF